MDHWCTSLSITVGGLHHFFIYMILFINFSLKDMVGGLMSAYFCPHSVFNSGYLIEFVCLKSDLIDNSVN